MKNLSQILKLLTIALILFAHKALGQSRFIGDTFGELKPVELFSTSSTGKYNVTFVENHYVLKVNKKELINSLKKDSVQVNKEHKHIYGIVVNYLEETDNLVFEYVWTQAEDFDNISWFETEKLGERNLTKKVLKGALCAMIDNGKFELIEDGQRVKKYFFERIDSNYGGNVKGVFSSSKRLIWICPPFIID